MAGIHFSLLLNGLPSLSAEGWPLFMAAHGSPWGCWNGSEAGTPSWPVAWLTGIGSGRANGSLWPFAWAPGPWLPKPGGWLATARTSSSCLLNEANSESLCCCPLEISVNFVIICCSASCCCCISWPCWLTTVCNSFCWYLLAASVVSLNWLADRLGGRLGDPGDDGERDSERPDLSWDLFLCSPVRLSMAHVPLELVKPAKHKLRYHKRV